MLHIVIFKTESEESAGFLATPHEPVLKEQKNQISLIFKKLFHLFNNHIIFKKSSSC